MKTTNCLNCEKKLTDKYCAGCGQKADTHRITFKNFMLHDILHGTFHIDRGILYTAKQALTRPGKASLDYISGKRKRYYNVFYLILIIIGLMLFFRHIDDFFYNHAEEVIEDKKYLNEASKKMDEIISQKSKFILLLFIPFSALNSYILFRRKELNLSEHSILSGMILLGILLLGTFANIYFPLNNYLNFNGAIASAIITVIIVSYVCYAYYDAFSIHYTKWGITYRILLFYAFICIEIVLLFLIVFGFISNWKFGTISVDPFG